MDEISTGNKIKYFAQHSFKRICKSWNGPYAKVILNNNIEDSEMHCKNLNSIFKSKEPFNDKHRVLVLYEGEKNFCVVSTVQSYTDIDKITDNILKNYNMYSRKKVDDHAHMIDKIYLLTNNNEEIEVVDIIDMFIQYSEPIKMYDIVHVYDKKCQDINLIKIIYYKDMECCEKIFDFQKLKNENIDVINGLL